MNPASLPLSVQVGLGVGYLAYLLAYSAQRSGHSTMDATFLSLLFGIPALLFASFPGDPIINILVGSAVSLAIAAFWRADGRRLWHKVARDSKLNPDDGYHSVWEALLQQNGVLYCSQISVHTADGRVLYLNDRERFKNAPYKGLSLGADGSILMVVEEEKLADGTEEARNGISDPDWGTRMTYIPADQVRRVNIRF